MSAMDPNQLDLVAAVLTLPAVDKYLQPSKESRNLDYEFQLIVENYFRMRTLLIDENERLAQVQTEQHLPVAP